MFDITAEPKIRAGAIEITARNIEIAARSIEIMVRNIEIGTGGTSFVISGIDSLGRWCEIGRSPPNVPPAAGG